jgi:hypothetical protein
VFVTLTTSKLYSRNANKSNIHARVADKHADETVFAWLLLLSSRICVKPSCVNAR